MFARTWLPIAALILALTVPTRADEKDSPDPKGKPTTYKVGSGKYAVWYDDSGWHFRATSAKDGQRFTGTVAAVGGKFASIKLASTTTKSPPAKKKGAEPPALPGFEGKTVDVKFTLAKGSESGFDLKLDGDATGIKFELKVDDKEAPELILIGAKGAHPKEAAFELPAKPTKKKK